MSNPSQYFFILGRNPALSLAEISSLIRERIIPLKKLISVSPQSVVLELEGEIDAHALMSRMGGVIKIGKIIKEALFEILKNQQKKKIYFGFSDYSRSRIDIHELALQIKDQLKESGISSRWVTSRGKTLSSVVVSKNQLLSHGGEFVFLDGAIGQTLAVQEFEEFGFREFGRPELSPETGMIPAKLAKILVNLAEMPRDGALLDPFCGSGTILTEALAMGYGNIAGMDISEEAIDRTRKNISWTMEHSKFKNEKLQIKIERCDARKISEVIPSQSIGAIVTEPYLGPIKSPTSKIEIQKTVGELSSLYLAALREWKKVLSPKAQVVMVWPVFENFFLPILDQVERLGFRPSEQLLPEFSSLNLLERTPRGSIIYSRPDSRVRREIFVFRLKH